MMLRFLMAAALIGAPLTAFGQNTSSTTQVGEENDASTIQVGDHKTAITAQSGNYNSASMSQSGGWNAAAISQIGDDHVKSIQQNGNYQGYGSFQMSSPHYTGTHSSFSRTSGNSATSLTLEFEIGN